jgi:hypothetical protein
MASAGRPAWVTATHRPTFNLALLLLVAGAARCGGAPAAAGDVHDAGAGRGDRALLVVGSINADTTVELARLPARGECITSLKPTPTLAVGGKVRSCLQIKSGRCSG